MLGKRTVHGGTVNSARPSATLLPSSGFPAVPRPEKAEIGLRDDGRGRDVGGLDYERRDRGRQDVLDEDFPIG
jgi:hypothetical protein